jgi:hypothetical protein
MDEKYMSEIGARLMIVCLYTLMRLGERYELPKTRQP